MNDLVDRYSAFFETGIPATLDTTEPERLLNGWRIVREMARQRGVVRAGQPMAPAVNIGNSPMDTEFSYMARRPSDPVLAQSVEERPLALTPVIHTEEFLALAEYLAIDYLKIHLSPRGRRSLQLLLNPLIVPDAWPTPSDILSFEHFLASEVLERLLSTEFRESGEKEAKTYLIDKGLQDHEIFDVLRLARTLSTEQFGLDDMTTFRSFQAAMMLKTADKQLQNGDYRGSAQTRRDVLRILDRTDSGAEDMDSIVEQHHSVVRKKRLEVQDP